MYTLLRPRAGHRYWGVRISLPGGKPKEVSTKCERKSDARAVAERLHAEAAASATREPLVSALETLIGMKVRQKRSVHTIEKLEDKGANLVRFFGADCDVKALRLEHTTAYVQHRREQRVSDSTIAMELTVLLSTLRYLRRLERYERDPKALWPDELPHGSGVRSRWLTWPEYLLVLNAMAPEFKDHLTVYIAAGLRFGELYSVRAGDLTETAEGWELRVRGTKTAGAARTTGISADGVEVLQRRALQTPDGPLFPVTRGSPKSQKTAWGRALSAACRAARVKHAIARDLRRSFCSWGMQRGVAEWLMLKWMGHASSTMVRTVYAQASSEQHAREGAKLPSRKAPKTGEKPRDSELGTAMRETRGAPMDLSRLDDITLIAGAGDPKNKQLCLMSAVAWLREREHGDAPPCVCPVIRAVAIRLNDGPWWADDAERTAVLMPLVAKLVDTRGTPELELKRARLAAHRALSVFAPLALEVAGLNEHAAALRAVPAEFTGEHVDAARAAHAAARAAYAAAAAAAARAAYAAAYAAAQARDALLQLLSDLVECT